MVEQTQRRRSRGAARCGLLLLGVAAAWPGARLTVVPDAGHSALEPGVRTALVGAVERFRRR